jgi:hypothetical protein
MYTTLVQEKNPKESQIMTLELLAIRGRLAKRRC